MTISRDAVLDWLKSFADIIAQNKDYLTQLDSDIGDGDHGANMNRGMQAVLTALPSVADKDIGSIFKTVGMKLVSTVGGASGPLYGTMFMQMGNATAGKMELTLDDWVAALQAGTDGVVMRGKAQLGDKTMVDALTPALNSLKDSAAHHASIPDALNAAASAAEMGMKGTIPLVARKGRASYLGERSAGHQDPGATSSYYLMKTAAETWNK
ncbi:MAG TPA: dihydroxyacetone kinase subunit DhaL [Anaerolineae bacterium]|nr:dihydroxyacetone kinase subunit DhaL [Anaerolineae bacterium]